jgi:hypothetical protein
VANGNLAMDTRNTSVGLQNVFAFAFPAGYGENTNNGEKIFSHCQKRFQLLPFLPITSQQ